MPNHRATAPACFATQTINSTLFCPTPPTLCCCRLATSNLSQDHDPCATPYTLPPTPATTGGTPAPVAIKTCPDLSSLQSLQPFPLQPKPSPLTPTTPSALPLLATYSPCMNADTVDSTQWLSVCRANSTGTLQHTTHTHISRSHEQGCSNPRHTRGPNTHPGGCMRLCSSCRHTDPHPDHPHPQKAA